MNGRLWCLFNQFTDRWMYFEMNSYHAVFQREKNREREGSGGHNERWEHLYMQRGYDENFGESFERKHESEDAQGAAGA